MRSPNLILAFSKIENNIAPSVEMPVDPTPLLTSGWKAGSIAAMIRGATVLPVPVFDIDRVVELIERENVTMLPGPPTLYHSLLEVTDKSKLTSLRAAVTGASDIPVELIRRVHNELPFGSIMTGHGLTEGGTVTASRPGDSFEDIATTVGMACDGDDPVATAEAVDTLPLNATGKVMKDQLQ
jgi:acyl-CoA synthetase (AMP-forming)/AMP-acid ligase II